MSYEVLARKYRPKNFAELLGQEHVSRTLRNAIEMDRVAHAFLFSGTRGVGKTTVARILAKSLNCVGGPTPDPCLECASCREIAAGNSIDTQELDGASNNSVEDVRTIRDAAVTAPARDRFKIFIIDEVHMLSGSAFNALLKVVEEPPRHVKFMFATTDPEKVPVTVLSRCQRYDFRRVSFKSLLLHLTSICASESLAASEDALRLVCRQADGSVRDALSLLDRVISFSGKQFGEGEVTSLLGLAPARLVSAAAEAVVGGDAGSALARLDEALTAGCEPFQLGTDLLGKLRGALLISVAGRGAAACLDVSDTEAAELGALAERAGRQRLEAVVRMALKAAEEASRSAHPRVVMEVALVRMASTAGEQSISEAIEKLEALERRLAGGAPAPPRGAGGAGGQGGPASGGGPMRPARSAAPAAPRADAAATPAARAPSPAPAAGAQPSPARPPQAVSAGAPHNRPAARSPEPAQQSRPVTAQTYGEFVEHVKAHNAMLGRLLEHAKLVEAAESRLVIGLARDSIQYQTMVSRGRPEALGKMISSFYGSGVRLEVRALNAEDARGTAAEESSGRRREEIAARELELRGHPSVLVAQRELGAVLRDVEPEDVA